MTHIKGLVDREARSEVDFLHPQDVFGEFFGDFRFATSCEVVALPDGQCVVVRVVFRDEAREVQGCGKACK